MPLKSASKKAAYTVVDISKMSRQAQDEIKADALSGGGLYGLIVVELAISGGNQTPLFGYYPGDAEKKWKEAQAELADDSGDEEEPEHETTTTQHVGVLADKDLPPVDHSSDARRKPAK